MRPDTLNPFFTEVTALPGVGSAVARLLERLEISRVRDLLFHLPIGWRHTRTVADLRDAREGERVAVPVTIMSAEPPRGRTPARLTANDASDIGLRIVFFGKQGHWLVRQWAPGTKLTLAGRLELFNGHFQMAHPEVAGATVEVEPIYPLTEGLTSRRLQGFIEAALDRAPQLPEWIEPSVIQSRGWPAFADALSDVHRNPESRLARDRLAYDEMLASQLAWALVRAKRRRKRGVTLTGDGTLVDKFVGQLPFRLTGGQAQAVAEILGDMGGRHAMLRLLQGDVGSGKTVVALIALLRAVEAGAQGALLAPTDLLARQHMQSVEELTKGLPITVGFLSGREKGRQREDLLARLESGEIDILVGTHAIFQERVKYRNLGMAVIDEQHRFGVSQRLMLAEKAERPPHLLVMTATPIPRTLALANFGEMDVSRIAERPPGRQPIDTRIVALSRIDEIMDALGRHVAAGKQAYWVCPTLDFGAEEQRDGDASAPAIARADMLKKRLGDKMVALVHGKMAGAGRDREMERFDSGEACVLVATTVIEVGVNVPNATLMLIESAERFGLAQLHQLRGRVGRGSDQSACLLLRGAELSETAKARLKMMRETDDGFRIAEADLALRGAGELLGTRQSGDQGFVLADDQQVASLLPATDKDARLLIDRDGGLEGERGSAARLLLYLFQKDSAIATLKGG